jgi:hypothetical protein
LTSRGDWKALTGTFDPRHGRVGHLFQGRLEAVLVGGGRFLPAPVRCVEGTPIAARLADAPADRAWSSCRAHPSRSSAPAWLDRDTLNAHLLGRDPRSARPCSSLHVGDATEDIRIPAAARAASVVDA